jgi:hypothetical protein
LRAQGIRGVKRDCTVAEGGEEAESHSEAFTVDIGSLPNFAPGAAIAHFMERVAGQSGFSAIEVLQDSNRSTFFETIEIDATPRFKYPRPFDPRHQS